MAVLLVAAFPILLLIFGPVAVLGLSVGILLLYRDNREQAVAGQARAQCPVRTAPRRTRSRSRMAA